MKMKLIFSALPILVIMTSEIAYAFDGNINFTGTITEESCTVATESVSQTINLGTFSSTSFTAVGQGVGATPFTIVLSNCPESVTQARARFEGATNAANTQLLAITPVPGAAANVGIGLYEANNVTPINMLTDSVFQAVTTAGGTLRFVAKYVATSASVTAGTANATVNFTLSYQ